jgi:hypothetical protein
MLGDTWQADTESHEPCLFPCWVTPDKVTEKVMNLLHSYVGWHLTSWHRKSWTLSTPTLGDTWHRKSWTLSTPMLGDTWQADTESHNPLYSYIGWHPTRWHRKSGTLSTPMLGDTQQADTQSHEPSLLLCWMMPDKPCCCTSSEVRWHPPDGFKFIPVSMFHLLELWTICNAVLSYIVSWSFSVKTTFFYIWFSSFWRQNCKSVQSDEKIQSGLLAKLDKKVGVERVNNHYADILSSTSFLLWLFLSDLWGKPHANSLLPTDFTPSDLE